MGERADILILDHLRGIPIHLPLQRGCNSNGKIMDVNEDDPITGPIAPSEAGKSSNSSHGTRIDADSMLGTEANTTISVSSNVWKFEEENGRTYHGYRAGVYYYPNDPPESVRLDYQSCVLDFAFNHKLHQAPLSNPRKILDIGTGTGAWAIQMGDTYPSALIEATDLSPIQPTNVPENVHFIIDDAEEEDWAVAENHYDYIHTRVMMGCFEDFRDIIRKGFKYTKPGGWMESVECMNGPYCDDGTMPPDWPFKEWTETMEEAAGNAGRPLAIANKIKTWYIELGFVDVHEKITKIPINSWPRDKHLKMLGKYWAENLLAGLQGFSLALFSRVFGWSKPEIEVYLVKIRKSITDHQVHAYTKVYTVWGRKPDVHSHSTSHPIPEANPTSTFIPPRNNSALSTTSEDQDLDIAANHSSEAGSEATNALSRPASPVVWVSADDLRAEAAEVPLPANRPLLTDPYFSTDARMEVDTPPPQTNSQLLTTHAPASPPKQTPLETTRPSSTVQNLIRRYNALDD